MTETQKIDPKTLALILIDDMLGDEIQTLIDSLSKTSPESFPNLNHTISQHTAIIGFFAKNNIGNYKSDELKEIYHQIVANDQLYSDQNLVENKTENINNEIDEIDEKIKQLKLEIDEKREDQIQDLKLRNEEYKDQRERLIKEIQDVNPNGPYSKSLKTWMDEIFLHLRKCSFITSKDFQHTVQDKLNERINKKEEIEEDVLRLSTQLMNYDSTQKMNIINRIQNEVDFLQTLLAHVGHMENLKEQSRRIKGEIEKIEDNPDYIPDMSNIPDEIADSDFVNVCKESWDNSDTRYSFFDARISRNIEEYKHYRATLPLVIELAEIERLKREAETKISMESHHDIIFCEEEMLEREELEITRSEMVQELQLLEEENEELDDSSEASQDSFIERIMMKIDSKYETTKYSILFQEWKRKKLLKIMRELQGVN